jgi:hypothetical protein
MYNVHLKKSKYNAQLKYQLKNTKVKIGGGQDAKTEI